MSGIETGLILPLIMLVSSFVTPIVTKYVLTVVQWWKEITNDKIKQAIAIIAGFAISKLGLVLGQTIDPNVNTWTVLTISGLVSGAAGIGIHSVYNLAKKAAKSV